MRTLIIGALLVCTVCPASAKASSLRELLLHEAKEAFDLGVKNRSRPLQARKHFADATDRYLELHKLGDKGGVPDAGLYLNLGNAAALADRWPEALWAYHLGLKLDPNDARLREHCEFVRAKVLLPADGLDRNENEYLPPWLYRPSGGQFAVIAGLAYTLAWLAGTVAFFRPKSRIYSGWLALLTGAAILLTFASGFGAWHLFRQAEIDAHTPLVILADNTPLQRGNGANYPTHPDLPLLPRGTEARQLHRRGGWLQIRLSTNEIGWIPAASALIVEP